MFINSGFHYSKAFSRILKGKFSRNFSTNSVIYRFRENTLNLKRFSREYYRNFKNRLFSTINESKIQENLSIAPFSIRIFLVGISSALGTPFYVFGGFVHLWLRYLPKQLNQVLKYGVLIVVGGGLSKLSRDYVLPFLTNHADIILPLAICNGVTASFWYGLGELVFGLEVMTGLSTIKSVQSLQSQTSILLASATKFPIAGSVVGMLTAITAPLLWPYAFNYILKDEVKNALFNNNVYWMNDAYDWIMIPIGVPIGALGGVALQIMLSSVVVNSTGPWQNRSLPALCAVSTATLLYLTLCTSREDDYMWYSRMNPLTGEVKAINYITKKECFDYDKVSRAKQLRNDLGIGPLWSVVGALRELFSSIEQRNHSYNKYIHQSSNRVFPKHSTLHLTTIDDYQDLMCLVDILVRYKYLTLNPKYEEELKQLEEFALRNLGITDIAAIYSATEAFVQNYRNKVLRLKQHDEASALFIRQVYLLSKMDGSLASLRGRQAITLLGKNIDVVEDELKEKFGYVIPDLTFYQKNRGVVLLSTAAIVTGILCLRGISQS